MKCACGAVFTIGATKPEIEVEVCSQCHPFFTGKDKLIDAAGRVEKFQAKVTKSKQLKSSKPKTKKEKNLARTKKLKEKQSKK
ncbi:MAG: 50S ribosomal protein L31 [Parcubacteria group bacterium GW2011_GWC1_45_9]|nr:MAG: 50S ribosomal protein L31 [Parcubacteria group bacterium GW2011_GWB1_45_10]KKU16919.1 MAG: 50S ribosomal protein L31 [Parcubacteria group bacterium GW2011_GWC1_45_9]